MPLEQGRGLLAAFANVAAWPSPSLFRSPSASPSKSRAFCDRMMKDEAPAAAEAAAAEAAAAERDQLLPPRRQPAERPTDWQGPHGSLNTELLNPPPSGIRVRQKRNLP